MGVGRRLVLVFLLAGCLAGCRRITPHARTIEEIRVMLELRILWLQTLGFEGATDLPIIGWEVDTVAGTGIRLVPQSSE
jgi:hypothetical protein